MTISAETATYDQFRKQKKHQKKTSFDIRNSLNDQKVLVPLNKMADNSDLENQNSEK